MIFLSLAPLVLLVLTWRRTERRPLVRALLLMALSWGTAAGLLSRLMPEGVAAVLAAALLLVALASVSSGLAGRGR